MNKEIWLWLLLVMGPNNDRTLKLVEHYGDVKKAAEAIRDGKCELVTDTELERAKSIRSREVRSLIEECNNNDIRILTIEDDEYPSMLKEIYEPPIVLFVQGSLEGLYNEAVLAVVGTRNASPYGLEVTRRICTELAAVGITIVSGLAVGLDSTAHQCALDKGARTIGVLACGHLVDYPFASHNLKQNILRSGGALISELPPHTPTSGDYFKYRNRIISGLAVGTFITEAPERSGCLLTAEHTVEQGRELFCLAPHDVTDPHFTGVVPYLRDGAVQVFSHIDIVDALKYSLFKDMVTDEELS